MDNCRQVQTLFKNIILIDSIWNVGLRVIYISCEKNAIDFKWISIKNVLFVCGPPYFVTILIRNVLNSLDLFIPERREITQKNEAVVTKSLHFFLFFKTTLFLYLMETPGQTHNKWIFCHRFRYCLVNECLCHVNVFLDNLFFSWSYYYIMHWCITNISRNWKKQQ